MPQVWSPQILFPPWRCFTWPWLPLPSLLPLCWSFCITFVCSNWKAALLLRTSGWLSHRQLFPFFACLKSWATLAVRLGSFSIYTMKHHQWCSVWLWAESITFRIQPASSVSSHQKTSSCYNATTNMFDTWCLMGCSFPSPYCFFPIILIKNYLSKESNFRTCETF